MTTQLPTFDDRLGAGDFILKDFDERYNYVVAKIQNKTGVAILAGSIKPGAPLNLNGSQWETLDSGSESGAEGVFADSRQTPALAINGITPLKYKILRRGPALAALGAIPKDPQGTQYVVATMKTLLEAMSPPVMTLSAATITETQEN